MRMIDEVFVWEGWGIISNLFVEISAEMLLKMQHEIFIVED